MECFINNYTLYYLLKLSLAESFDSAWMFSCNISAKIKAEIGLKLSGRKKLGRACGNEGGNILFLCNEKVWHLSRHFVALGEAKCGMDTETLLEMSRM